MLKLFLFDYQCEFETRYVASMPPLPPLGRDGIKNDEASLVLGQKEPYFTRPLGRVIA